MMAGLFSVSLELENPFRPTSIDAVRVRHEMKMARLALRKIDREVAKGGELWDAPLESDVEHDEGEDEENRSGVAREPPPPLLWCNLIHWVCYRCAIGVVCWFLRAHCSYSFTFF